ncbi:hypothetical protein BLA29_011387, partial [Euroglyphus maynei]
MQWPVYPDFETDNFWNAEHQIKMLCERLESPPRPSEFQELLDLSAGLREIVYIALGSHYWWEYFDRPKCPNEIDEQVKQHEDDIARFKLIHLDLEEFLKEFRDAVENQQCQKFRRILCIAKQYLKTANNTNDNYEK